MPLGTYEISDAPEKGLPSVSAVFTSIEFLTAFLSIFEARRTDTQICRFRFRVFILTSGLSCIYSVILVISGIPAILGAGTHAVPFTIRFCIQNMFTARQFSYFWLHVNLTLIAFHDPVVFSVILDQHTQLMAINKYSLVGKRVIITGNATPSKMQWYISQYWHGRILFH